MEKKDTYLCSTLSPPDGADSHLAGREKMSSQRSAEQLGMCYQLTISGRFRSRDPFAFLALLQFKLCPAGSPWGWSP